MKSTKNQSGFTLVEVLLVVVIIAILAAVVIVAINPGRQIAQTNNTQRQADVKAILDAVHQYAIDNRGTLPAAITANATNITNDDANAATSEVDICSILVPTYLAEIPFDPTATGAAFTDCTAYNAGYTILKDADGRITVSAPSAELNETISVTR